MVELKILTSLEEVTDSFLTTHYEYLLAVSTDTLAVVNSKLELEKFVIKGNDNDAFLCACTDINHFLDCLTKLEEMINNDNRLLMVLRDNYGK